MKPQIGSVRVKEGYPTRHRTLEQPPRKGISSQFRFSSSERRIFYPIRRTLPANIRIMGKFQNRNNWPVVNAKARGIALTPFYSSYPF